MTRNEIFAVIKSNMHIVIEGVDGKEVLETNSMRDFGADSLEIVEVVSRSIKQLKIKVPRTRLLEAQNLKDLLDIFEEAATRTSVS
jgi:acyl carrier protein